MDPNSRPVLKSQRFRYRPSPVLDEPEGHTGDQVAWKFLTGSMKTVYMVVITMTPTNTVTRVKLGYKREQIVHKRQCGSDGAHGSTNIGRKYRWDFAVFAYPLVALGIMPDRRENVPNATI